MQKMIERHHIGTRMSQIVTYPLSGQAVLLCGLCADDRSLNVAEQTAQVLAKIDGYLAEAGVSKADIVAASIWLRDIATFDEMNAVWDAWVPTGSAPVRACVEARLADPSLKVEIQVQAIKAA